MDGVIRHSWMLLSLRPLWVIYFTLTWKDASEPAPPKHNAGSICLERPPRDAPCSKGATTYKTLAYKLRTSCMEWLRVVTLLIVTSQIRRDAGKRSSVEACSAWNHQKFRRACSITRLMLAMLCNFFSESKMVLAHAADTWKLQPHLPNRASEKFRFPSRSLRLRRYQPVAMIRLGCLPRFGVAFNGKALGKMRPSLVSVVSGLVSLVPGNICPTSRAKLRLVLHSFTVIASAGCRKILGAFTRSAAGTLRCQRCVQIGDASLQRLSLVSMPEVYFLQKRCLFRTFVH